MIAVAPAPQPRARVNAGDYETCDHVAGHVHVDELVPEVVVEQGREGAYVAHRAVPEGEPHRVVHPAVHRDHHERAGEAGDHYRDPAQEMDPPRQAIPPVHVDGDEDRLEKEREALERERLPEYTAELGHERGPEQTELE